jgi:hypothetical protein
MPFATYTINKIFFENYREIDNEDLSKFNIDIQDLNLNQKAILIENENYDIKKKLGNAINQIANDKLDDSLIQKKELLENTLNNLDKGLIYKITRKNIDSIHVDFEKLKKNEINRNFKMQIIEGNYYPEDFNHNTERFIEKFLGKIEIFIKSKFNKVNDKINILYIYHKELSSYLMPNKESVNCSSLKEFKDKLESSILKYKKLNKNLLTEDEKKEEKKKNKINEHDLLSMKKIEYGVNLIYKWWCKLSDDIKPDFKILTDLPNGLRGNEKQNITTQEISFLEKKTAKFLFYNNNKNNTEATVKMIKQIDMPGHQGWKHKRHWIFGPDIGKVLEGEDTNSEDIKINLYAVKSDFGVEIVDPNNTSKLSNEMELKIITNKNAKQMRDIEDYLKKDAKKSTI